MCCDFRDSRVKRFPDLIKFREKELQSKDMKSQGEIVESRYFSKFPNAFNLKTFITQEIAYINSAMKVAALDEKQMLSLYTFGKCVLSIQLFLIERQLYETPELEEIGKDISNLIETLVVVNEAAHLNAKKEIRHKVGGLFVRRGYSVQSSQQSEWILIALEVLS